MGFFGKNKSNKSKSNFPKSRSGGLNSVKNKTSSGDSGSEKSSSPGDADLVVVDSPRKENVIEKRVDEVKEVKPAQTEAVKGILKNKTMPKIPPPQKTPRSSTSAVASSYANIKASRMKLTVEKGPTYIRFLGIIGGICMIVSSVIDWVHVAFHKDITEALLSVYACLFGLLICIQKKKMSCPIMSVA